MVLVRSLRSHYEGSIAKRTSYYSWDSSLGHFKEVVVKSTMTHRTSILKAVCGQSASFAIKAKNSKEPVHKADVAPKHGILTANPISRRWSFAATNICLPDDPHRWLRARLTLHVRPSSAPGYAKSKAKMSYAREIALKVVFQWLYRPEFAEEGFESYFKAERKRVGSITKVSFDGDKQKSWPDSRKQQHGTNTVAMNNATNSILP